MKADKGTTPSNFGEMRSSIVASDCGVDLDLKGGSTRATLFFDDARRTFDVAAGEGILVGGKGDRTLLGGAGDDLALTGRGEDLARGGAGDDARVGGRGEQVLDGDAGLDVLFGGGDDLLRGGRASTSCTAATGTTCSTFAG